METNGDVYCTAIGRASNDGATPDTPIDSLTRLLGRYKIEPEIPFMWIPVSTHTPGA